MVNSNYDKSNTNGDGMKKRKSKKIHVKNKKKRRLYHIFVYLIIYLCRLH